MQAKIPRFSTNYSFCCMLGGNGDQTRALQQFKDGQAQGYVIVRSIYIVHTSTQLDLKHDLFAQFAYRPPSALPQKRKATKFESKPTGKSLSTGIAPKTTHQSKQISPPIASKKQRVCATSHTVRTPAPKPVRAADSVSPQVGALVPNFR